MAFDESQPAAVCGSQQAAQQPRVKRKERVAATLADWRNRWPAVFTKPVPLAVGLARQIKRALPPDFPRKEVGIAVHHWTQGGGYLRAVARGDTRRNLDGSEAGAPNEEAREQARQTLAERERRALERRTTTPQKAEGNR